MSLEITRATKLLSDTTLWRQDKFTHLFRSIWTEVRPHPPFVVRRFHLSTLQAALPEERSRPDACA